MIWKSMGKVADIKADVYGETVNGDTVWEKKKQIME